MNALSGCVASLTLSTETLQSTIETLSAAVEDYPRVCKILSSNRHFELISAKELTTAQTLLSSTIQPETDRLLRETEKAVHKLELKERKLIADAELLETRIANSLKNKSAADTTPIKVEEDEEEDKEEIDRKEDAKNEEILRKLKAQRQRLAYAVERLELEKRQKEMLVKKSMSYNI
ncbi:hypothetical protein TWF106_007186 [Orbilia oligospora]|uniref:DASH complex subunit SPC19 n=1 Tax=Orbilia oligospora TaxID=2813651 RepID=A0A6G1MN09_ORBOL|nr:hypothetical protein TWF788_000430 [Orbilia oligospora]KAF3202536.1 hypothetical protein TWF679_010781 [Orbilia oligospora]KAF3214071.1 hypothetical protein TWF191_009892 [Orbilia oligospora]KAF3219072.1 hypothetical protein TWF106_007186 [Orbilia oligospora]KAF3263564.1 hypothetical protein TWF192_005843 [Orbilia oligospora]